MLLPDVNVWVALAFESHIHHAAAKSWFDGIGDEPCAFCRLTQQGFLRLSTNPKALGNDAVTLDNAWAMYDSVMEDHRLHFAVEPAGIELAWREFTAGFKFSTKVWSDAYIAAFAHCNGWCLVSFDNGFKRYDKLQWLCLT